MFMIVQSVNSQTDSTGAFSFSGYVDAYVAYYTDSLGIGEYQAFPTVSPRSEQFGLNIAQISAKYAGENARATVTLHYGDIPMSAWSGDFNFIQEANAGFKICDKLWVDAGFFRTHIGAEGLYPKENIASSIAIPTWFEPYFEAGLKFNYLPTDKLTLNLYLLNGYNVYRDSNKKKGAGLQALYAFTDKMNIGYTNYFGDESEQSDSITHTRIYNNIFLNYEVSNFKFTVGIDFAMQQNSSLEEADQPASMYSGLIAIRYMIGEHFDVYARGEMFNDPDGFLSGAFLNNNNELTGLSISGGTLGLEYKPTGSSYVRLEGRSLLADDNQKIFYWDGEKTNNRIEMLLNVGVWFE